MLWIYLLLKDIKLYYLVVYRRFTVHMGKGWTTELRHLPVTECRKTTQLSKFMARSKHLTKQILLMYVWVQEDAICCLTYHHIGRICVQTCHQHLVTINWETVKHQNITVWWVICWIHVSTWLVFHFEYIWCIAKWAKINIICVFFKITMLISRHCTNCWVYMCLMRNAIMILKNESGSMWKE
jgi:hypothetical protein